MGFDPGALTKAHPKMESNMFEWMGVGIPERDAPIRALATAVVLIIALVCVVSFVYMWYFWPFWIAFPAGLALIAIGIWISLVVVDRIVGKKVKPPYDRFGE
jgi:protein-S-isoprenylcysteine O-methyltransferase Ste14